MAVTTDQWWGEFNLEQQEAARWDVGPLSVAVQRLAQEWLVAQAHLPGRGEEQGWQRHAAGEALSVIADGSVTRYVLEGEPLQPEVVPALADRPVVSRPYTPFVLPAGGKATMYVSTPLWFTLAAGSPRQSFFETPIVRPSDTWFGPSTREGELCYASHTFARLTQQGLEGYVHRAITQVNIHNASDSPLLVERLNLPVPFLSLYQMDTNALYTESVGLVQVRGTALTEFTIGPAPAAGQGSSPRLIAAPRRKPVNNMVFRAFSTIMPPGYT